MGRTVDGAKSGLIAGIPYGAVLAVTSYFTTLSMKQTILADISKSLPSNSPLTPNEVFSIALVAEPIIVIIVGIVGGLILGAIYGWAFDKVPGGSAVIKGIVFGIVLWFIFSVLGGLGNLQYGIGYFGTQVAIGLGVSLLFGSLLGLLYRRFSKPKELLVGPT